MKRGAAAVMAAIAVAIVILVWPRSDDTSPLRVRTDGPAGGQGEVTSPRPPPTAERTAVPEQPDRGPGGTTAIDTDRPGLHVTVLDTVDAPVPGISVELTGRLPGEGSSGSRFARATPGARDVELVLQRGGSLSAWIRTPDGVPAQLLIGRIGNREPNQFAEHFGATDLLPGPHDVTVRIRNTAWEIALIPSVHVPEGRAADDPRLDGIEVACRPLKLLVLAGGGAPLVDARLWLADPSGRGGSLRTDAEGRVLTAVPTGIDRFVLRSHELGRADFSWSADELTVHLRRQ